MEKNFALVLLVTAVACSNDSTGPVLTLDAMVGSWTLTQALTVDSANSNHIRDDLAATPGVSVRLEFTRDTVELIVRQGLQEFVVRYLVVRLFTDTLALAEDSGFGYDLWLVSPFSGNSMTWTGLGYSTDDIDSDGVTERVFSRWTWRRQ